MRFLTEREYYNFLKRLGWKRLAIAFQWSMMPTATPYYRFKQFIARELKRSPK